MPSSILIKSFKERYQLPTIINSRISNKIFRIIFFAIYIFYNCCRKHATNKLIPKHVMDNYNDRSLMEKMEIAAKNSRKRYFERNKYNEGDVVLLTNWISKLSLRNHTSRKKPKKGTNHQRTERYDIKGVVTKAKLKICYIRIIEIVNERKEIETQQEIRVPNHCVIKQNNFFIIISIYLIIYFKIIFTGGGTWEGTWREVPSCTFSPPQVPPLGGTWRNTMVIFNYVMLYE